MTLDKLLANLPDALELKKLWIVIDAGMNDLLKQVQPFYQHQASPLALTNGDFAICADLLGEVDGLYKPTFLALDQSLFPEIPVVPFSVIEPFIPLPSVEQ